MLEGGANLRVTNKLFNVLTGLKIRPPCVHCGRHIIRAPPFPGSRREELEEQYCSVWSCGGCRSGGIQLVASTPSPAFLLLFVDILSPPPRLPEVAGGVTSCHSVRFMLKF